MTQKIFRFRLESDSPLCKDLEEKENFNQFINALLEDYRLGKLHYDSETLENLKIEKIKIDIEYKRAATELLKNKNKFFEVFDSPPSKTAAHAMKIKSQTDVKGVNPPEQIKLDNIIDLNWNKFIYEIRHRETGWVATCKICNTGFIQPTKEDAISRFKKHLEEAHDEELLKL